MELPLTEYLPPFLERQGERFAEPEEIAACGRWVDVHAKHADAGGPPLLCGPQGLLVSDSDIHALVFGSTGSMKTRRVIMIQVWTLLQHGENMIVSDLKSELYGCFAPELRRRGYQVLVLNLRNPACGSRWNPLSAAWDFWHAGHHSKAVEYIRDLAQVLFAELSVRTKDVFWGYAAMDYFTGLALYLCEMAPRAQTTMENVAVLAAEMERPAGGKTFGALLLHSLPPEDPAGRYLAGTLDAPEGTRTSILSEMRQPLSLFTGQDALNDMLSDTDIDFFSLKDKPTAIFLIAPDEKKTLHPILTAFISQTYLRMIEIACLPECGGKLPIRTNFVLDEFGNLPPLDDINSRLTASRSRNIRFMLVAQGLSQLYCCYGESATENILGNCDCLYYLHSRDWVLLEKLSRLCGTAVSPHTHEASPLVSTSMLQHFSRDEGETLLLLERERPFITHLPDISAYGLPLGQAAPPAPRRPGPPRTLFSARRALRL